jgi:hypothetical protein
VVVVEDAVGSGELVAPSSRGALRRLVIVDRSGLVLVESKCTLGSWSYLRRMERKAVRRLSRSARADPRVTTGVVLASSLKEHRVGVAVSAQGALLAGSSTGRR